jgi:hypothetical protein
VEGIGVPLPARECLTGLLRIQRGGSEEEATRTLEQQPLRLAENLTRGQAEDLLARLLRERVDAKPISRSDPMEE